MNRLLKLFFIKPQANLKYYLGISLRALKVTQRMEVPTFDLWEYEAIFTNFLAKPMFLISN